MSVSIPHLRLTWCGTQPPADQVPAPGTPPAVRLVNWRAVRRARQACCCSAPPVAVAVMPPVPGRGHQTEVLLCGHHYRASRQSLANAGASVVDMTGMPIAGYEWPEALTVG
jgi:hypothetical protein